MKLKVTYARSESADTDVVVDTDLEATIESLAEEIMLSDPQQSTVAAALVGEVSLAAAAPGTDDFVDLAPDRPLGECPLTSGYRIRVVRREAEPDASQYRYPIGPTVHLTIKSGVQAGKRFSLGAGSHLVGRNETNDVVLTDPMVSGTHARLVVGSSTELVDLNSANGILVDGSLVSRLRILPGQQVVLGETTIDFDIEQPKVAEARKDIVGAALPFNRSPRVEERYPGNEYAGPEVPKELDLSLIHI